MRTILLVISVLAAVCCTAQSSSFINTDKVSVISGKVLNYTPNENNRMLSIRILPVYGRDENVTVPINDDGSFTIQFKQPFTGDHHMKYAGKYFTFYCVAGAKETVEIDDKLFLEDGNRAEAVKMSGESGIVTSLIMDWTHKQDVKHYETQIDFTDTSKTDKEIIDLHLDKMKNELTALEAYIRENNVRNDVFHNWAKNEIMYRAGSNAAYGIQGGVRRNFTFTEMFHLFKNIPCDNPQASSNSSYYRYLSFLSRNMALTYKFHPALADLRLRTGNNAVGYVSGLIDSFATGEQKQLLYFYLFTIDPQRSAYYQQDFDNVVLDNYLRNSYESFRNDADVSFKEYNLLEKLKAYKADAGLKSRLITLFEKEKDKFVYLDFWGTWCEPCMKEMAVYGSFIDQFKGRNLTFIFMGVNTPEKEALKVKNKYRINGRFISLNSSEVELLRDLLKISGYPTHKLLKPGSKVTNYGADKIINGTTLYQPVVQKLETILTNAQ